MHPQVLFKNRHPDRIATLEEYRAGGGYQALSDVIAHRTPAEVREIVLDAALLGRGGAAFPAGRKMATIAEDAPFPRYVVCNADEMEPGTFKDRVMIHADPHMLLEGIAIAAWAVRAERCVIFIRPEYENAGRILEREIEIAKQNGFLGAGILGSGYSLDVVVHRSAGRYICGEVTAQINALMGIRPNPRQPPPYLTEKGLWDLPTLVHNVETLACLPHILRNGAEWFKKLAKTPTGAGTKLFGVSGKVKRPGCYELPIGIQLARSSRTTPAACSTDRSSRPACPAGPPPASCREALPCRNGFRTPQKVGNRLGTGAIMVFDHKTCLVAATLNLMEFFARESCGWCTPCREGLPYIRDLLALIEAGEGQDEFVPMLEQMRIHLDRSYCAFAPGAVAPLESLLVHFQGRDPGAHPARKDALSSSGRFQRSVKGSGVRDENDRIPTYMSKSERLSADLVRILLRTLDPGTLLDDQMPKLIIDEREIEVAAGTKVIEAAARLGIMIPRFCYHPALGAVGACRVCAVKVLEGPVKGIQMSCMLDAADGMIISTTDDEAIEFRRYVIEWLMMNHPHDCPVCDEGGHCLLQDLTVSGGHGIRRFPGKKRTYLDQDLGPLVQHEMNRCIHCYRCPRFYQEFCGYRDLGVFNIGNRTYFGRVESGTLEAPFSGNLSDICPTGVYTDKPARFFGRRWDYERTPTLCINCSLGCHTMTSVRYRKVTRQEARFSAAVNGWFLCDRGRFGFFYASLPARPRQARVNGETTAVEAALTYAREKLEAIRAAVGPQAVALIGSPRSSLETLVMTDRAAKLKGWKTPSFFADADMVHKVKTAIARLEPELAVSLREVEQADLVLAVGADPINEAPMLALALRQAVRNGARVVVLDPRPVELPLICPPAGPPGGSGRRPRPPRQKEHRPRPAGPGSGPVLRNAGGYRCRRT